MLILESIRYRLILILGFCKVQGSVNIEWYWLGSCVDTGK